MAHGLQYLQNTQITPTRPDLQKGTAERSRKTNAPSELRAHIIADETLGMGQAEVKDWAGKATGQGGWGGRGMSRGIVSPGEKTNGQHGNSSNRRRSEAAVA